jgi:signal transduction histidine kinase
VSLVVGDVVADLQAVGIETPEAFDALRDDKDMFEKLRQRVANLPQLEALTLDSPTGHLINMSRYFPVPEVDITDRDYYQTLLHNPRIETTISAPMKNRGSGSWNIYLAHRVTGPKNELIGFVLGAMKLDYFERLYESISSAGNIHICLWRGDGTLLARYPTSALLGQVAPSRAALLTQAPGKTIVRTNFVGSDGQKLIIAARKLVQNGLIVEVSENASDALADWRHDAAVVAVSGATCVVATILLMLALMRQFRIYDAMSEAIAAREEAITARHQAEARLLEAQKLEAIGRVTSGIAHDFNNLLGSISGNVELLLRDKVMGPQTSRRLSVIQQAADRGAALIRQLLAFSRQQVLTPAPVVVNNALETVVDLLEGSAGRSVRINLDIPSDVWPVMVDVTQFEYMILNLVMNARDAMPSGGAVTISACNIPAEEASLKRPPTLPPTLPGGEFVAVAVADTGQGMAPEVLRKAFDPFFTTKPPGSGSGLGLSQVYGLAKQSGGLAQIRSSPGEGTTVTVFLPRAHETKGSLSGQMRVLLVEDDEPMRDTLAAVLRENGFTVSEAADGPRALDLVAQGMRPTVLVADLGLPGMDGMALATQLRKKSADMAVVLMSGDTEPADSCERFVIQKPFSTSSLVRLIHDAVTHAQTPEMTPSAKEMPVK